MENIFSGFDFCSYDEFLMLYNLVKNYSDISGIASDSVAGFIDWYTGKSSVLDIPNKTLQDYLSEFMSDCGGNHSVMRSRLGSVLTTARFKGIFEVMRGTITF